MLCHRELYHSSSNRKVGVREELITGIHHIRMRKFKTKVDVLNIDSPQVMKNIET